MTSTQYARNHVIRDWPHCRRGVRQTALRDSLLLQNAFIFAKARQGPKVARESLALARYLGLLLALPRNTT